MSFEKKKNHCDVKVLIGFVTIHVRNKVMGCPNLCRSFQMSGESNAKRWDASNHEENILKKKSNNFFMLMITSISSQLASSGMIFSTVCLSKPSKACNSYARCCKSVECDADSSSISDWHCRSEDMSNKLEKHKLTSVFLECKSKQSK